MARTVKGTVDPRTDPRMAKKKNGSASTQLDFGGEAETVEQTAANASHRVVYHAARMDLMRKRKRK